ncbi:MAG: hypothetical protein HZB51_00535 [Chloroflexi bacterium]|nr:hypothetical protein [Chloroflexota bacterium]
MKAKQIAIQFIFLCLGIFVATATNLALASNLEPQREARVAPAVPLDDVDPVLSIQGFLTNASGAPLNGSYNMTFRIYDISAGGTALCSASLAGVQVTNGQFGATIYCYAVEGQQLWLGITVGADPEMTPRQPIRPTAYALSLRPGAVISSTLGSNPILHIENWGNSGRGLRSYAMDTDTVNYGIVGASASATGYAGYFYNSGGGTGLWTRSIDNGNDLILGGNADSTQGDDGILSSDPTYASSDLILRTNDGIRVELDHDGNGEDADFEINNKDSTVIFNVDESGDVSYTGALIGAYPRPAYDSGWRAIGTNATLPLSHALGGAVDDYVVDFICKSVSDGVNSWGTGGDWNWEEYYGAYWYNLTTSSVTVKRMNHDVSCSQVRIRIWVYK